MTTSTPKKRRAVTPAQRMSLPNPRPFTQGEYTGKWVGVSTAPVYVVQSYGEVLALYFPPSPYYFAARSTWFVRDTAPSEPKSKLHYNWMLFGVAMSQKTRPVDGRPHVKTVDDVALRKALSANHPGLADAGARLIKAAAALQVRTRPA